MFLVIFGYIFCVMPITVMHLFHDSGISDYAIDSYIHFGALCLSRLQYSMYFFIYCARNEQYQNAYKYFFKKVWWILYTFKKKSRFYSFLSLHIGTTQTTWTKSLSKDWSYIFHEKVERQFESTNYVITYNEIFCLFLW